MSKLKTKSKRPARLWQRVFGFLPVISFGGAALILSIFTIAPNFMNFTHAEEKPALKPSDIKLSMSVDEAFHKFNDVYLSSDGVEHEDQNNVTFKPTVETNNPAGYKVFFSDVDEDTSMQSIDATVTDSIRSATTSDFENGVPKNTADNYWYCGILQVPDTIAGEVYKTFFSTNNDLSIPARSKQKLIDEVKYVKPNDNQNNGVFCNISVNKQLAPSTYVGKMIFTTVANTNNLKPATLKHGYSAFRKIPNNRVFRSFEYTKPTPRDFSDEVKNDESIVSNIKPDYEYAGMPGPACPPTREVGSDMYNLTANNTDDEEPVLIWISTNCIDGGLSLRWWSPSGILRLGENCSNFFSTANAPRFDNLDLSGVDLSKCKNMESMFERTDEGFKRINFGDNQFSPELNNTKKMFKGNNKLEEIRTNHDLDLTYVSESSEMFDGNTSLVGSYFNDSCIFTEYNTAKTDGSMAKTINGYFHRVDSDGRHCVAVRSE